MTETGFVFAAHLLPRDGYGYASLKIAEAFERLYPGQVQVVDLLKCGQLWTESPVLLCAVPDWLPDISAPRVVIHTMFEATRLPEHWRGLLNQYADGVVVPCKWCAGVFRDNGWDGPLQATRWGVDTGDYWILDRKREAEHVYQFLWSGTPGRRKGWDVAYTAFRRAFGDREDVRLTLHFRHKLPRGLQGIDDNNVSLLVGLYGRPELRELLRTADCFVFPSRGEGWGLPPREAAATGLPVIATNFGGLAEEIENWALPVPVEGMSAADYGFWTSDIGLWAEPDIDMVQAQMAWCADNQQSARAFGLAAGYWLAQFTPWERTARGLWRMMQDVGC